MALECLLLTLTTRVRFPVSHVVEGEKQFLQSYPLTSTQGLRHS